MTSDLNESQSGIRDLVEKVRARFYGAFQAHADETTAFPHEFHKAFANAGFPSIAMPTDYRRCGSGYCPSPQMIVNFIAEKVLDLPKSY